MPIFKKDEIALMTVTVAKMNKALKLHPLCSCSLWVFSNPDGDNYVASANSCILSQNRHACPSCSLSHVIFAEAESQKSQDKKGCADAGMHVDTLPSLRHITGLTHLCPLISLIWENQTVQRCPLSIPFNINVVIYMHKQCRRRTGMGVIINSSMNSVT